MWLWAETFNCSCFGIIKKKKSVHKIGTNNCGEKNNRCQLKRTSLQKENFLQRTQRIFMGKMHVSHFFVLTLRCAVLSLPLFCRCLSGSGHVKFNRQWHTVQSQWYSLNCVVTKWYKALQKTIYFSSLFYTHTQFTSESKPHAQGDV